MPIWRLMIALVIIPSECWAKSRQQQDACGFAAFTEYNNTNLALMQTYPAPMPPIAVISQRRLQEQYCAKLAACIVGDPNNSTLLLPYSAAFAECLRDEAQQ